MGIEDNTDALGLPPSQHELYRDVMMITDVVFQNKQKCYETNLHRKHPHKCTLTMVVG